MNIGFPNWPKDKRPVIHYQPGVLIIFSLIFLCNAITFINSKRTPTIKEWETHRSEFYGYQISYPEDWRRYDITIAGTENYPDLRTTFDSTALAPEVSLLIFQRSIEGSSLNETAEWGLTIMNGYWLEPSSISDVAEIQVGDYSALTRTYEIRSKPQKRDYRDVYLVSEDKAFVLKFNTEPNYFDTADQYYFEPIMQSFIILDE